MAAASQPRPAAEKDLDAVVALYEGARRFMAANGNPTQWAGGYPGRAEAERDLAVGGLWVLDDPDGDGLAGVMSVLPGPDPTYVRIEGALHGDVVLVGVGPHVRVALAQPAQQRRAAAAPLARDRHAVHDPVRAVREPPRALERAGFSRRGTIWVEDGTSRIAYHHVAAGA